MWRPRRPSLALMSLLLVSCGDGKAPTLPATPVPTSVTLSAPTLSFASLGQTQQLTVTVLDQKGQAMPSTGVSWASSNAEVASVSSSGLVTSVGNGTASITAMSGSVSAQAAASVQQKPALVVKASGDAQVETVGAEVPKRPQVKVTDANRYPVGGVVVNFAASAGGGSVTSAAQTTASDGLATVGAWTLGKVAGPNTLSASVQGLEAVSFSAVGSAGPAAALLFVTAAPNEVIGGSFVDTVRVEARDQYGNSVPGATVHWTADGQGASVSPATTTTGGDGRATVGWQVGETNGVTYTLRASLPSTGAQITVSTRTVAPQAPFRFAEDTDWTSPDRNGQLTVLDERGLRVPASYLTIQVDDYPCCNRTDALDVDFAGKIRQVVLPSDFSKAWRVRASLAGTSVRGIMMVVTHRERGNRTVFRTQHWRLVVPSAWIEDVNRALPDGWGAALDVGWLAQAELKGMTAEGAQNRYAPSFPLLDKSSLKEDPTACGYSSNPLSFGYACFVQTSGPYTGHPQWSVIFHEMGHLSTMAQQSRDIFPQIFVGKGGGATFVEGDASLLWTWSAKRIVENTSLPSGIRASVQALLDFHWRSKDYLRAWEASGKAFADNNESGGFDAGVWCGIQVRLIDEFGWEWVRRYARSFRNDAVIGGALHLNQTTVEERATFAAAAVSAAIGQDLRARFKAWRFPVSDALFDTLYARLVVEVQKPWADAISVP